MKKIYSSLWLLLAILQQVLAQNNDTTMSPVVFGIVGDNAFTAQNHTNTSISFMIGQAFVLVDHTTPFDTTRCGFPYEAQYMQNTFAGGLACSKGYYSNYVLLQWNIVNNSSLITNVVIYRRPVSLNTSIFQLAAKLDASVSSWQDIYCESGTIYEYKVVAEGISGAQAENKTYVSGIGFRQMEGTATGRITYAGGTAVMGVSVIAETKPAIATSALQFSESNKAMLIDQAKNGALFTKDGNFSFQTWVQDTTTDNLKHVVFDESTFGSLYIQNNTITFSVKDFGDASILYPKKEYFHISAIIDGDSLILQLNDGKTVKKIKKGYKGKKLASTGTSPFYIGNDGTLSSPFKGLMKDIRFWSIALDSLSIQQNYDRVLAGTEVGLKTYYRCNEGVGSMAYDIVHVGKQYKANNATLVGGITWSNTTPSALKVKGVTDKDGNYIISGIPYTAEGSSYQFIPMMSQHSFNPSQALRYYAAGSDVSNNVDFTDKSSFVFTGVVKYKNTSIPVEGVSVLIDGTLAFRNNKLVTSNDSGRFVVDVPIGQHKITLAKQGHNFVEGFPGSDCKSCENGLWPFNSALTFEPKFFDNTLATLAGRVVGGTVEQAKPLGFGQSKNNVGLSKITLEYNKLLGDLNTTDYDSTVLSNDTAIKSKFVVLKHSRKIVIYPDSLTGEYEALFPPGEFTVLNAYGNIYKDNNDFTATDYDFADQNQLGPIDLDITKKDSSQYNFVVTKTVNGKKVNSNDSLLNRFNKRRDFIYRNVPTIQVTQENQNFFGDSRIEFTDSKGKINDTLFLIKDSSYTKPNTDVYYFGYPIFHQQAEYTFQIKVFESYMNKFTKRIEEIPQPQGDTIIINNGFSALNTIIDTLSQKGILKYTFTAGDPNLLSDHVLGSTFTYKYKKGKSMESVLLKGPDAIILGAKGDGGSPFITTGPSEIDMILRDPPGSTSFTSLEKGTTVTKKITNIGVVVVDGSLSATVHLGPKVAISSGIGVMLMNEVQSKADVEIGIKQTIKNTFAGDHTTNTTNTELWSTSADPAFVGSLGDVFIGHSTNIVFGRTKNIAIIYDSLSSKYKIKEGTSYSMSPEFNTSFKYTQYHIINILIPNLIKIRNSFFEEQPNIYKQKLANVYENTKTWKSTLKDTIYGDAYNFFVAEYTKKNNGKICSDSVLVYTNWIKDWENILAQNEKVKVESIAKSESKGTNHSFDAGTSYQNTSLSDDSQGFTYTFNSETYANGDIATGCVVNGVGITVKAHVGGGINYEHSSGKTETNSITYNYMLSDNNQGDYLSVDVIPATDGYGPVFRTRGGSTKCPYEGKETAQYFEPSTKHELNVATEKAEIPDIRINKNKEATQLSVPSTQAAIYTLSLGNISASDATGSFNISLAQNSNPNGALITIDGVSLTQNNGLVFYIPSSGSLTKTLSIAKGPTTSLKEKIGIVMTSSCGDASDTVWANVEYTPACTPVELKTPLDMWTINGVEVSNILLPIKVSGFNRNETNFESVVLEYKPSSSSTWKTLITYYNDSALYKASTDDAKYKSVIANSEVSYNWNTKEFSNQNYDIRAHSQCINNIIAYSEVATGIKDVAPIQRFGTPQPTTGILGIGDNIGVQFNKPIVAGAITDECIEISGVLNDSHINHETSLNLDSVSAYAKADGFSFAGQPFTIELWMQRLDSMAIGVLFSKGENDEKIEFSTAKNNALQVKLGSNTFAVDPKPCFSSIFPANAWHHYALVYDTIGSLRVFADDKEIFRTDTVKFATNERSSIYIGRSVIGGHFGKAFVHDIRIWNKTRSIAEVNSVMDSLLSGSQVGLLAYWPLNEGNGTIAKDRAGSHSLTINASWKLKLQNQAILFEATKKQALLMNTKGLSLSSEQNATIEFWFKAAIQPQRACLLYNGLTDSTSNGYNPKAFGLFLEPSTGILTLTSGGQTKNASFGNVCDNSWHHFAIVIDRLSNVRTYIDGNVQSQLDASLFVDINFEKMSVGAYRNKITSDSSVSKHYFTGMIDELRIWGSSRQASLINNYKYSKIQGTETGLLFYFPFEHYHTMNSGVQEIETTLKNQLVFNDGKFKNAGIARIDSVEAELVNNPIFTKQAPTIKDALPTETISVNYVVNNDKLLINLPEQFAYRYEKCILDISVEGIYDKNGNRLKSAVQWTAFINQNPVVWSKPSNSITINSGETGTFTVDVVNKGGKLKDFSLNGLPVWLKAEPEFGTLQPNSSQTITFTINSGLNIGSYSLPINLTTDYGYDEKLQVDVNIKAKSPSWTVDASTYQYMMNVFGKVSIDGVIATNENTLLAAFVNGECRGVTNLKYLSNFDITEAMLSIYSNSDQGETIELRIWDANTGKTYSNVTPVYTFNSDKIFGSPKIPELISCDNTLLNTYNLSAGWNWISVNIKNAKSNAVNNLFSTIGSNGDEIKSQKKGYNKFSKLAGWSGTLDTTTGINPAEMYKIKLTQAGVVTIGGKPFSTATTPIVISKGWNWIGFVPQYNVSVNEALASYGPVDGDLVKSQKAFSMFYTGIGWIGSLTVLEPGKGYMLQSTNASSLIYPELGLLKSAIEQTNEQAPKVLAYVGGRAQSNTTIIAQLADESIEIEGTVLAAYNDNTCVGYASAVKSPNGKQLFFITADESSQLEFALVDIKTGLKTRFINSLNPSSNSHLGEIDKPYLLYASSKIESNNDVVNELLAYPNPFQSKLVIEGNLLQDSPLSIRLLNDLGKELLIYNTTKTKGLFNVDLSSLSSFEKLPRGFYVVEIKTNDGTKHISIVKQ